MIARIYNALAIVAIATLLAFNGFCAYLVGSGRLNAGRLATIAAVLRGELEYSAQAASAPEATQAAAQSLGGQSADPVRAARQAAALRGQMLERAKHDVEARQRLLDQALQHLLDEQEQAKAQQTAATRERAKGSADQDPGFQRELEIVAGLPPAQAKEYIVRLWKKQPADAVRMVMNLDTSRVKKVFGQMKTPEEMEVISQLLEQLRQQDPESYAQESGTTEGAAPP
jgi:hypothetical protein